MELSQLRMFKTIVDLGSIAKAAEQLHCVPSNITTRIKNLEEELGEALFIRKGRGLSLSPAGDIFLSYVNNILSLCQEAKRAISADGEPIGTLRFGAIESAATSRLPKVLSLYHKQYPKVHIEFSTGKWKELETAVVKHELDSAVIAGKSLHPDIECVEIYQEELVLIAPATFDSIHSPGDLIGKNIYMWPEGCPYRKTLENWLETHQIPAEITSIASYGTILGCVSSGAGISLVPKGIYEQLKLNGGIEGYHFDQLKPIKNYLLWNKNIGFHKAKDALLALVQSELSATQR
ncbi:LysR family transcriptional regulator [Marinomonas pollencensis]|uniref:DNA-binding transcriptional LysR family regulator n=1 Tax=Marinomonas pollencensis TaxID=491954 RepID=A0A3E0DRI2_9GAMM|nr:LysR family transcriptional regulator [Marinomonas pollencensis]REG85757.1 DNA-binding transcriptional LysR family regulator [Marinomonas pollencensis]